MTDKKTPIMFRTHIYHAAFPGMIGAAEFEQVPEDDEMIRVARALRRDPEFEVKYLAYATAETLHEGWMPKEVWDHVRTPTYHRVLGVLLGCEDMSEDDKRARRRQAFLTWLGSSGVNERWMYASLVRMLMTGSPILTPHEALFERAEPGSPEYEAQRILRKCFETSREERQYLGALRIRLQKLAPSGYL
jgi:hypothetical protein